MKHLLMLGILIITGGLFGETEAQVAEEKEVVVELDPGYVSIKMADIIMCKWIICDKSNKNVTKCKKIFKNLVKERKK